MAHISNTNTGMQNIGNKDVSTFIQKDYSWEWKISTDPSPTIININEKLLDRIVNLGAEIKEIRRIMGI